MSTISDLLVAKGNAEAQAVSSRGNIYADLIRNLSSLPGQYVQQQEQDRKEKLKEQLTQQQIALGGQQLATGQRQAQDVSTLDRIWNDPSVFKPDGSINRDGVRQRLSDAGGGHLLPQVTETIDHLDESRANLQQKQQALAEAQRESLGKDALQLDATNSDAGAFHLVVAARAQQGLIPKDQATALLALTDPAEIKQVTDRWKAGTAAGAPKYMSVGNGGVLDERTGKMIASGKTPTPTEASLAADLSSADPAKVATAKTALDALKGQKNTTAEQDDQRYRMIQANLAMKKQLTPDDQAWATAYEKQKTLGVDTTASAASARQATAIDASTKQQGRAQHFTQLQAARADIAKSVDAPYASAIASADELRALVTSAQGGNKVAGSLQSLQTAATALRANGINRLNMAEISMPATAGSAVDRFLNAVGKFKDGQPVDASLQKDMLQVADVLEKAADKKYRAAHTAATKLYDVPELQPSFPPLATQPAGDASTLTPGLQGLAGRP